MQKTLTIIISTDVYEALQRDVGRGKISKFIENLIKRKLNKISLNDEYKAMAKDLEREKKAQEWSNNLIEDIPDATW